MSGIVLVLSSCDKELSETDENKILSKLSPLEEELISSTNQLSIDLLKAEYALNADQNHFFSPVSINMALGMVYNAVGKQEKLQILQSTGLETMGQTDLNKTYNQLLGFLQTSNQYDKISYANSMWFSMNLQINEEFRTRVMAYYDAEIGELNFNRPSCLEQINQWGKMKTRGSFEQIMESAPNKNSGIFLINAFGLHASWKPQHLFADQKVFINAKGEQQEAQMLNWDGLDIELNENEDCAFIEFPFEDKSFYFSAIVPTGWRTTEDIMHDFSIEKLKTLQQNASPAKANLTMPDISFSDSKALKTTLSQIGLEQIFSSKADLSPSFEANQNRLDNINHKASITISSPINVNPEPAFARENFRQLTIDRPFIYFIRDKHTQTILFAGYFANPTN
ncbi:MAG: serpin family protein [Cyclobacteriaceae bacterium]|nr:serpin family protein [Cyclobacteriaceae bacterium]